MREEPPFEVVLVAVPVGSGASEAVVVVVDALGVHQEAVVVVVEGVEEGNWNSRSSVVQALVASPFAAAAALDYRLY